MYNEFNIYSKIVNSNRQCRLSSQEKNRSTFNLNMIFWILDNIWWSKYVDEICFIQRRIPSKKNLFHKTLWMMWINLYPIDIECNMNDVNMDESMVNEDNHTNNQKNKRKIIKKLNRIIMLLDKTYLSFNPP